MTPELAYLIGFIWGAIAQRLVDSIDRRLMAWLRRLGWIAAFVVAVSTPVFAEDTAGPQVPPPPATLNDGPMSVEIVGGAVATLTGETEAKVAPNGYISIDGPLPVGRVTVARGYTHLAITTVPGETPDLTSVETWRAGEARLGLYRVVGRLEAAGQDVRTSIVAEAGFGSRFGDPQPSQRLVRHFGVGIRLEERKSGALLTVLYGRAEQAGDAGYGQAILRGQVPLAGTRGALVLVGDAIVSVGPRVGDYRQRDVLRLGIAISLGDALKFFTGKGKG